jgi:DNA transposition AAA+ family ATPase
MSDEIIKCKQDSAVEVHVDEQQRLGNRLIEALRRNSAEVGEHLVHVATGRSEKAFTEEVIKQVEELVKHKNALLVALDKTGAEIRLTERRLAAIADGEIKIGWDGRITYNEPILNF